MASTKHRPFDPEAFLDSTGVSKTMLAYAQGQPIYSQGGACDTVLYIKSGEVKLWVTSKTGREAVVAVLGAGNFFGEGALAGQPLRIGNSDPTYHNVHAVTSAGDGFNEGMPAQGGEIVKRFFRPEIMVRIRCEVHPWMSAYIVVTDHPYYAVTDLYGEYELSEVPPGTYQLKIWHETLGVQEKRIEVKAGAAQQLDFSFTAAAGVKK